MKTQILGFCVFSQIFWQKHQLSIKIVSERSDVVTVTNALLLFMHLLQLELARDNSFRLRDKLGSSLANHRI